MKWIDRVKDAWAILIGRATAFYGNPDDWIYAPEKYDT